MNAVQDVSICPKIVGIEYMLPEDLAEIITDYNDQIRNIRILKSLQGYYFGGFFLQGQKTLNILSFYLDFIQLITNFSA